MNYKELDKAKFDAIVTGELTHYAIWLEGELVNIISDYFVTEEAKVEDFNRLLLLRDGLTFQDKIEIVRAMSELFNENESKKLKTLLKKIEAFKKWRNAMAHGRDVSNDEATPSLKIQIVSRSGKENTIEITPESHTKMLEEADLLLNEVQNLRKKIKFSFQ